MTTKAQVFSSAQNKLAQYDKESEKLMLGATIFDDAQNAKFTLPQIVSLLRKSFKQSLTHRKVLNEPLHENRDPSDGFCMASSYLIYSMTGGDKVWEIHGTPLHWWLYHKKSGTVFDITRTQFSSDLLPDIYKMGCDVGHLTTDEKFYDTLKIKAKTLAHCAGLE